MRYVGGKHKIASWTVDVIMSRAQGCTAYLEPFMGSCAILARIAPQFKVVGAGDLHPDLVMLMKAVARGWIPPESVPRKEYYTLKDSEPSAMRGFAGFGCSFGGKWFGGYQESDVKDRGAGTSYPLAATASRSLVRIAKSISHVDIRHCPYEGWSPRQGTLVYCDPPYQGRLGYQGVEQFSWDTFWNTMREWHSRGTTLLISGESAPDDFGEIACRTRPSAIDAINNPSRRVRREAVFMPKEVISP